MRTTVRKLAPAPDLFIMRAVEFDGALTQKENARGWSAPQDEDVVMLAVQHGAPT
jgi:hypothetical protein